MRSGQTAQSPLNSDEPTCHDKRINQWDMTGRRRRIQPAGDLVEIAADPRHLEYKCGINTRQCPAAFGLDQSKCLTHQVGQAHIRKLGLEQQLRLLSLRATEDDPRIALRILAWWGSKGRLSAPRKARVITFGV